MPEEVHSLSNYTADSMKIFQLHWKHIAVQEVHTKRNHIIFTKQIKLINF